MRSWSSKHASLASPRRSQVVTTPNLSHRLPEDIAGGIDVAIVTPPAAWTLPLPFIEPQLIEHVPQYEYVGLEGCPHGSAESPFRRHSP